MCGSGRMPRRMNLSQGLVLSNLGTSTVWRTTHPSPAQPFIVGGPHGTHLGGLTYRNMLVPRRPKQFDSVWAVWVIGDQMATAIGSVVASAGTKSDHCSVPVPTGKSIALRPQSFHPDGCPGTVVWLDGVGLHERNGDGSQVGAFQTPFGR